MDPFVAQLADLCASQRTRAKWVFVPTHGIGLTLGERIVLEGTNWLNLRFVTPLDVALPMAGPFLVERGIDPSEEGLGPALMMRLLLDLPLERAYFRPLADHPTMAQALWTTVAAYYVLPYFDVGVRLDADGKGGIDEACGAVHYLRPDGSTLLDRNVYTLAQLKAAGLRRTDPKAYRDQLRAGYIHGVEEDRPAVISINMQMASIAVNEFLARLHPYRHDENADSAIVRVSFIQGAEYREREPAASGMFSAQIGKGDVDPLLSMPELSEPEDDAA